MQGYPTSSRGPYQPSSSPSFDNMSSARAPRIPSEMTIPIPSAPAQVNRPTVSPFAFSQEATQYPNYIRSLGENQAQESFQNQVNQGIRSGNAAQGYQRALDNRNQTRLSVMGQAGQEQMRVEQSMADTLARHNDQLLNLYGLDLNERAHQLDYIAQLYGLNLQQRQQAINYALGLRSQDISRESIYNRGGGGSVTIGGGRSQPTQGNYIPIGYGAQSAYSSSNYWR